MADTTPSPRAAPATGPRLDVQEVTSCDGEPIAYYVTGHDADPGELAHAVASLMFDPTAESEIATETAREWWRSVPCDCGDHGSHMVAATPDESGAIAVTAWHVGDRDWLTPKPAPASPPPEPAEERSEKAPCGTCRHVQVPMGLEPCAPCVAAEEGWPRFEPAPALPRPEEPAATPHQRRPDPTHRCNVCGALWILNPPSEVQRGSWSLWSKACGKCCDNVAMGEQIEPITEFHRLCDPGPWGEFAECLHSPTGRHDFTPTCRYCHRSPPPPRPEESALRDLIARAAPLTWVATGDMDGARAWEIEAARALSAPPPGEERLREAAKRLVAKIDVVIADPTYERVWVGAQLHEGPYQGPQYDDELDALRAALREDEKETKP
jgi:hypothetical protein